MGLQIKSVGRKNNLIISLIAVFALVVQPMYGLVAERVANAASGDPVCIVDGDCYANVQPAVDAAGTGAVISLKANVTTSQQITVSKTLTIDGGGFSITGAFVKSGNANNSIISPQGALNTVTLSNLTISASVANNNLHGVNVYKSNAVLDNVTISNVQNTAVNVNSSIVTAHNIKTLNTATRGIGSWYSYNVIELADNVNRLPSLTITGTSEHNETKGTLNRNHIKVAAGSFTDSSAQYTKTGIMYNLNPIPAPVAPNITSPVENSTTDNSSVTISWDKPANANSFEYTLDGGATIEDAGSNQTITVTLDNGTYTAQVRAIGVSGTSDWSEIRNFTVDVDQLPLASITTPAENGVVSTKANGNKLKVAGTYTDDISVNYLQLQLVGGNSGNPVSLVQPGIGTLGGPFTHEITVPGNLTDGLYKLTYVPSDYSYTTGGQFGTPGEVNFTVDNTAPSVPAAAFTATPSNRSIANSGFTNEEHFKFDLSSTGDAVRYRLRYSNDIETASVRTWNPSSLAAYQGGMGVNTYIDRFTQGEGKHYFSFSACDAVDNCSEFSAPFIVTYDKTAPASSITSTSVAGDTLSFEGSVSDPNLNYYYCYLTTNQTIVVDGHTFTAGQEVRLNNNADSSRDSKCNTKWAGGSTDFTGLLGGFNITGVPDGEYTVNLVAHDLATNHNAATPARLSLTIDRTAPVIAITSATPSLITGTVGADAEKVLVRVGDQPEQEATIGEDGKTWTLAISPALTASSTVTARAVDAAGNTNSASTNPKWATRTISVPTNTNTSTRVTNNPLVSGNGTPSQGGSLAILANTTPTLQVTSPVADTTNETGDVAGATTVNKDSEDKGRVLAAEDAKDSWSLINLLLTIGIGVASIISLLGLLGSSRKDRKLTSRLLTIVPAAGAVVALLLIEDFSGSMIWVNIWSLLIGALAVIQMIILGMSKTTANE